MNDLLTDSRTWFFALLGLIGGLVRHLWKKQETRLDKLERDSVRRKEFEDLRADLRREHAENSGKLDKIVDTLGDVRTDIAVLQDRSGDGLFDDAGRVRR